MKRIFFISFLVGYSFVSYSQNSSKETSNVIDHLKDTVFINRVQTNEIYLLDMEDFKIREKYNSSDSLDFYKTKMQGKRDALYKNILSVGKYDRYKQKKIVVRGADNCVIIE